MNHRNIHIHLAIAVVMVIAAATGWVHFSRSVLAQQPNDQSGALMSAQACPVVDTGASALTAAVRILIASPSLDADGLQKSATDIMHHVAGYVPFNEFPSAIAVRWVAVPPDLPCLTSAHDPMARSQCAQALVRTMNTACSTVADLVVVLASGDSDSWRSDHASVLVLNTSLNVSQQAAMVANALGHRLGLTDEFEYDARNAEFSRSAANCMIGSADAVTAYWETLVGATGSKDQPPITPIKGCGDFPEIGWRPSSQSLMNDPLGMVDNNDAFGLVNQAYLRKMLHAFQ